MNFRSAVAVALLVLIVTNILPFSYHDAPRGASSSPGGVTCRFEPLQVCDSGGFFLGALADIPVLLPGTFVLVLSTSVLRFTPEGAFPAHEGFSPDIDHPPKLSA